MLHAGGGALLLILSLIAGDDVVGSWEGQWTTREPAGQGIVEVVITRDERHDLVGEFLFLDDEVERTRRLEGRVGHGRVWFELPEGGAIELRRQRDRLVGEVVGEVVGDGVLHVSPAALELRPRRR
jgi:hypothetical protein